MLYISTYNTTTSPHIFAMPGPIYLIGQIQAVTATKSNTVNSDQQGKICVGSCGWQPLHTPTSIVETASPLLPSLQMTGVITWRCESLLR